MSKIIGKCPICNEGDIVEERHFLSSKIYCTNCKTEFAMRGNKFKITKYPSSTQPDVMERLKVRMNQWHTLQEWRDIAKYGYTESEKVYIDALQGKLPALQSLSTNIILHKGETAFLEERSNLLEPHSVRVYNAGAQGMSVPIPGLKGVRYRVGGLKGSSESHEELKQIDSGTLLLTNKRIIFVGDKRSKTIKLEKIIQVEPYKDAVRVAFEGRKKPLYFTVSDGKLWSSAIEGLCKNA